MLDFFLHAEKNAKVIDAASKGFADVIKAATAEPVTMVTRKGFGNSGGIGGR